MKNTLNKYQVMVYPKALRDIDSIYQYIFKDLMEPSVAKKQIDYIWDAIQSLETFPYAHQNRLVGRYALKDYRQLIVNIFLVIYKIDENNKIVNVVTVQYAGRNL